MFFASLALTAQRQPQPLQATPYSPSLDLKSLDRSADPCVDVYKFSCGGWMKNNPFPADQPCWDVYAKLANETSSSSGESSNKARQPMVKAKACKVW